MATINISLPDHLKTQAQLSAEEAELQLMKARQDLYKNGSPEEIIEYITKHT